MKKTIMAGLAVMAALAVSACAEAEPPLAGSMSERSICSTAGYLIRQRMTDAFRTNRSECSVQSLGGGSVLIESGYIAPPNDVHLRYTAKASVRGGTLRMEEIKVHDVDDDFIPFSRFGIGRW